MILKCFPSLYPLFLLSCECNRKANRKEGRIEVPRTWGQNGTRVLFSDIVIIIFFFFFALRAAPAAYGSPRLGV